MESVERPSTKVTAMTIATAVTTVLAWLAGEAGLEVPAAVNMAIVVLVTFAAGYIVREDNPPESLRKQIEAEVRADLAR